MNINHPIFNSEITNWSNKNILFDENSKKITLTQKKLNKYEAFLAIKSIKNYLSDFHIEKQLKNAGLSPDQADHFIKNLTNLQDVLNNSLGPKERTVVRDCVKLMEKLYPSKPKTALSPPLEQIKLPDREDVLKSVASEPPSKPKTALSPPLEETKLPEREDVLRSIKSEYRNKDDSRIQASKRHVCALNVELCKVGLIDLTEESSDLQNNIRSICEIALIFKDLVGPKMTEKHPLFRLGEKFAKKVNLGIPATIELTRKKDASIRTVIKLKGIGSGGYKNVNLAFELETGRLIARGKARLKHPQLTPEEQQKRKEVAANEEEILTLLKDVPSVIRFEDVIYSKTDHRSEIESKEHQIIYMEYGDRGDLSNLLDPKNFSKLSEAQKKKIAHDLLKGMSDIHENGVIHFDIKPQNILLSFDPKNPNDLQIKFADFGLAKKADDPNLQSTTDGTKLFLAPEVWIVYFNAGLNESILSQLTIPTTLLPISSKVDDWAIGCILWQLSTGTLPHWIEKNPNTLLQEISFFMSLNADNNLIEPADQNTLQWIAWKMMRPDPNERWSSDKAFADGMTKEIIGDPTNPISNILRTG